MPYLTTEDETEIYYRDWASGPPIVLIHGWPFDSDMWERQATFLAGSGYRVITYDRRGFGRSGQPWGGFDYDTFTADLSRLLEQLDVSEGMLVGFSMGGGEVVRYLSRAGRGRIKAASLISAVTPFLEQTNNNPDGVNAEVFAKIEAQLLEDRPAFLRDFVQKFFGRTALRHTVSEPVLEWAQMMALRASPRATRASAMAWATTDFRDEMPGITLPVRIIHGTSDSTVPIDASARRAVKLLPNATLTEYEGEPHGLFFTAADRLNTELFDYAQRYLG